MTWGRVFLASAALELAHVRRNRGFVALTALAAVSFLVMVSLFGLTGSRAPVALINHDGGPYALHLGMRGDRLVFDIRLTDGTPVIAHMLSLAPFRRIVKDYFTVCDSYYAAIRTATPDRIEALDMGRRGLHDEGSRIVMERLKRKVEVDFGTARRLFTLITVLHWKG